ncbi:MAG: adenylate/guanylate cyclase domain-containing protein [Actinomycetota bacterium]|nr:adenylate/guanylate cyclase domain-containing protein [Acidimicrobiia bacterium]MDQ3469069.1 adenylate/guanylate cyclase domain-containing protein [Actinomycetota bacterium]
MPIHDPAHVRNALARFRQVSFGDEAARDRARTRLLRAARRFRIVPVGFITSELQSVRLDRAPRARALPEGFVTMMMTDIEGSTALVQRHGHDYRQLLDDVCAVLRQYTAASGGFEIEARADEFFAVFDAPRAAVDAAVAVQRALGAPGRAVAVRVRIGIHSGYPTSTGTNYIGLDVNTTSRVCAVGHGGQIVVTANAREGVQATDRSGLRFRALGAHRLRGLPEDVVLFQVGAVGLATRFPPLRVTTRA